MKIKELMSLPHAELKIKLQEIATELMKENAQIAIGTTPKNPGNIRELKKTRAKILMILGDSGVSA